MTLIPADLRQRLAANAARAAEPAYDPAPLVKLFSPVSTATWLATELDSDGDTLFGLADLGFGCPELGYFSLGEIASVRLPFGLFIERDEHFTSDVPLSRWAETARREGSLIAAERVLLGRTPLPPGTPDG